jgi:hypothetical protein
MKDKTQRPFRGRANTQSGVAILYILIAIALFATLAYTFSNSMQGGAQNLTEEEAKVYAQDILSYASRVERGVQRVLQRGCSESDVSFYLSTNSALSDYEHSTEVDDSCKVFHDDGGAISWQVPSLDVNDGSVWVFTGHNRIAAVGTDTATLFTGNDLVLVLPYLNAEVCRQVNDIVDVTNTNGEPPADNANIDLTKYTGSFGSTTLIQTAANEIDGKVTGCFETNQVNGSADNGTYHFYHVMIVR